MKEEIEFTISDCRSKILDEVDDEGFEPSHSRLEILSALLARPFIRFALAGILLCQIVGSLDADTADALVKVLLPLA